MPLSKAYQSITQLNSTFPCLKTWSPFAGGKKKRKAMMLLGGSMEACFSLHQNLKIRALSPSLS